MHACMHEWAPTQFDARRRTLSLNARRMFRNLANKLYGASPARATTASTPPNASAPSSSSSSSASASSPDADAPRPTTTFADRFVMSWNEEDVAFMGEDPYGDCAGNVFAQAAAESRRRAAAAAAAARARENRARASTAGRDARASMKRGRRANAPRRKRARFFESGRREEEVRERAIARRFGFVPVVTNA